MNQEIFKIGWSTLLNAFPNNGLTAEGERIYWVMLNKLPEEAFVDAVTTCLEECEFFPTIAKLREAASRRTFKTKALEQMQLDPLMSKDEARRTLADLIAQLPDRETYKFGKFSDFNRNYVVMSLPCIGCGVMCRLPFADGTEKGVLCEECNNRERHPRLVNRKSK